MSDTNSSGTIWWVYLLECTSGRIYTGVSPDVVKRVEKHVFGKGALFTRLNKPQRLLTAKPFPSKHEALKVEKQIKKMPAQGKRILASVWDSEREQLGLELPDLQQALN